MVMYMSLWVKDTQWQLPRETKECCELQLLCSSFPRNTYLYCSKFRTGLKVRCILQQGLEKLRVGVSFLLGCASACNPPSCLIFGYALKFLRVLRDIFMWFNMFFFKSESEIKMWNHQIMDKHEKWACFFSPLNNAHNVSCWMEIILISNFYMNSVNQTLLLAFCLIPTEN